MDGIRLLLCTDMDRTVIPNGEQPEQTSARERFTRFCAQPEVKLVYVTGRHLHLVQDAIAEYGLPEPDYAITDVGTKIYQVIEGEWFELSGWEAEIDPDWRGKSRQQIEDLIGPMDGLRLQEASKQNRHKLSYYLPVESDYQKVMSRIADCLQQQGVAASLIWSVDETTQTGLLDVLPRNATKLHAIEFLQQQLGYRRDEVVFAGDSGNDLPVLTSPVQSVLVANATDEVKDAARQIASENGYESALFMAENTRIDGDGNYSAGVLQGVWHYVPAFETLFEKRGMTHE
ncbi:HAD-IIB family hydrolase [Thiomicrorhabdus sp. ZW0627]|uniref:HAD-IIB family hydrolase n=1 Tax=Thiomicrorhabdus sp. ZW0627 TaxID=3039774 RepID=UPI00243726CF|nr:HAD-IIB family hydrolase [Thiomicrorhabdus sp. ZW0627]MDG6773976.1 HAD-IIB family hydrolase [Thiomicrorhabdus sp. ZW0627]